MAAPGLSEYRLRRRVNFYEVDSAGMVHFSCYFRYMEEAEHALWRAAGLSIAPSGAALGFPRVNAAFDYKSPLRFEDEFDVTIRIAAITDKSIRYACVVERDGTRIATGSITVVCVSKSADGALTATSIPRDIVSRFGVAADTPA
jgi:acyl-CoA thioester hydrolase